MNLIWQGIIGAYFPQRLFYYKAFQAVSQPDPATSTRLPVCDVVVEFASERNSLQEKSGSRNLPGVWHVTA